MLSPTKCIILANHIRQHCKYIGVRIGALTSHGLEMSPIEPIGINITEEHVIVEILGRPFTDDEKDCIAVYLLSVIPEKELKMECTSFSIGHGLYHILNDVPDHEDDRLTGVTPVGSA